MMAKKKTKKVVNMSGKRKTAVARATVRKALAEYELIISPSILCNPL